MYQTWIPIHGRTLSYENRATYLKQLRAAECTHIVIVAFEMERDGAYKALADHIAYFKENGVDAGIWIGTTIGHGAILSHELPSTEAPTYERLVNHNGIPLGGTRCPLDTRFRKDFSAYVARLAETGAKTILLDDDFRLATRSDGAFYCSCDLHMKEIRKLLGEEISREELRDRVFTGGASKYRDAWIKACGDSLRLLAKEIRDAVDPSVRIALCSAHSLWNLDGADGLELAGILAGDQPPLLRLHGAPYWAVVSSEKDLHAVFEIARMFASFCNDNTTELLAEGDVYPRPRYNVPASYLELFDAVIRADGKHGGILKYMVDYCASAEFETGYLLNHEIDLPLLKEIGAAFPRGANLGVRVHLAPHRFRNADLDLELPNAQTPYPSAGSMLQAAGIPTLYSGVGITDAVFGDEGAYVDPADFPNGMLLDAVSAIHLLRRGFDVGLAEERALCKGHVSALTAHDPHEHGTLRNGGGRFLRAPLRENAEVLVYAFDNGVEYPLLYRYENGAGQRFLVSLFSGLSLHRASGIYRSYVMADALRRGVEWLTGRPLPILLPDAPYLYAIAAETGNRRTVLLCNCSADKVFRPRITFDRPLRAARFVGCAGSAVGSAAVIGAPIPAFSFVLIDAELTEKK